MSAEWDCESGVCPPKGGKEGLPAGMQKERAMPIEEALKGFAGIDIPGREMGKGIAFVSFAVKEGEGAVFIKPLPLFAADSFLKKQEAAEREILHRADYLQGGIGKFAAGVPAPGEKPETFLKLPAKNISSGNARADVTGIYSCLEARLALCGLEGLAREETAFMGREEAGTEDYRAANSS